MKATNKLFGALIITTCLLADINTAAAKKPDESTISVMSFNIRIPAKRDGDNHWKHRKELVFDLIREHSPDVIGLQEAHRSQMDELKNALPGYDEFGEGRAGGTKGEYSAILYKRERFELDTNDAGNFWLSDTPEKPSKHWGNGCIRLCTWVRLTDRTSGGSLYLYNTHLDHKSQLSREKSVKLIASRIQKRKHDDPFILTGDFNAAEDNSAITYLKGADTSKDRCPISLRDSFRIIHPDEKAVDTFNGFGLRQVDGKIDYIFIGKGVRVLDANIIMARHEGRFPSDHFPVSARLLLKSDSGEKAIERDARMKWWREARFGMFIHWGVYSVPAGTYKGKQYGGIGEWIMHRAKIPVERYKKYAAEFTAEKYDPESWVLLAKEAGMKYIVITSKHHDGFALFDSKVTDWDAVDTGACKRDLLRPLVDAAKKHGLKIGFYYSQAQDWVHPGGAKSRYNENDGWDDAHKGDFDKYLKDIAYPQVQEILSGYGIDILWWDTPIWMKGKENAAKADIFRPILSLQPWIITNNRLGGGYEGDTDTPEQKIPDTGIPGRDWETCMTINDTWGYKSFDNNWKSTKKLIRMLIETTSKGGNFLLNVGPTPEGIIPKPSINRLKEMGKWMKVNSESIYGTGPSPHEKPDWGRFTAKSGKLYAHIFDWPEKPEIYVPDKDLKPYKAYLLADKDQKPLKTDQTSRGLRISLPAEAPDPIASVIVIECKGNREPGRITQ